MWQILVANLQLSFLVTWHIICTVLLRSGSEQGLLSDKNRLKNAGLVYLNLHYYISSQGMQIVFDYLLQLWRNADVTNIEAQLPKSMLYYT